MIRDIPRDNPQPHAIDDVVVDRAVARVQRGHAADFELIYRRYYLRVGSYVKSILGDDGEAEDVTQEVFAAAFRALPRYESRGLPFGAWLFKIARNCAFTRYKRRTRLVPVEPGEMADGRAEPLWSHPIGAVAIDSFGDPKLARLVGLLPVAQRQVIFLRYSLDMPLHEVGLVLERSPEGVRQLHHRAMRFLREHLSDNGQQSARAAG